MRALLVCLVCLLVGCAALNEGALEQRLCTEEDRQAGNCPPVAAPWWQVESYATVQAVNYAVAVYPDASIVQHNGCRASHGSLSCHLHFSSALISFAVICDLIYTESTDANGNAIYTVNYANCRLA